MHLFPVEYGSLMLQFIKNYGFFFNFFNYWANLKEPTVSDPLNIILGAEKSVINYFLFY